jgi:hypothetical protein
MLRSVRDLYKIKGEKGIYEYGAVAHLPQENIRPVMFIVSKTATVHCADGSTKTAYLFGEKTWSYDEQEIISRREEYAKEKEEKKARKLALDTINLYLMNKTTKDLQRIAKAIEEME